MKERPDIIGMLNKYVGSQIKIWSAKSNRASQIGDSCIRKLTYYRIYPELQQLHTIDSQYRFNEGNYQEKLLISDMQKAGLEIINQQRDFYDQKYQLSGHIDGDILYKSNKFPFDVKSVDPNIWKQIDENNIESLYKYAWMKKYPAQLQSYMFLAEREESILIFKNKSSGMIKIMWLELDFDYCENILQKCEKINNYVKKQELPDRILTEDCPNCPFYINCCPGNQFTKLDFINNKELEEKIELWEDFKEYALIYNKLNNQINESVKGIEKAIIGKYLITGKETKRGWQKNIENIEEK